MPEIMLKQWKMLQQKNPMIIKKHLMKKQLDVKNKKVIIECKKRYFRPVEVDYLKGNANRAKIIKMVSQTSLDKLLDEMIKYKLKFYNDKL